MVPCMQLSEGDSHLGTCSASAPGFSGACCETSRGRCHGTAVISLMLCTPSASQQCSTSTWQQSPMPSPLGACWGMPLPTCRLVLLQVAPHQPPSAQPVGPLKTLYPSLAFVVCKCGPVPCNAETWAADCSSAIVGYRPGSPVSATCLVSGTPLLHFRGCWRASLAQPLLAQFSASFLASL